MALTFAQARTILQGRIADSSDDTAVDQALNEAQREVARARRWPELMVDNAFINTLALYSTGTVVATEDSTTVTLTDGVWPATVASSKWRFALSVSDPWYEVATRSSDTVILLKEAYIGDTVSASSYVVYQSHYDLSSAVDRVEEAWVHDSGRHVPLFNAATDKQVTEFLHRPSGPGVPTHYYNAARTTAGTRRIQLGPNTPDDVYRVEYTYRKKTTDDTFVGNLDESRWPVILAKASEILYEPEFPQRALAAEAKYNRLLTAEWAAESESEVQDVTVGQTRMRYPHQQDYLGRLPGFGRVSDPT